MPINLDPNASIKFTLPSDADLPESCRVTFGVRVITASERARLAQLSDEASTSKWVQHGPILAEMLRILIVDWGGIKSRDGEIAEAGQLLDLLTTQEAWDLVYGAMEAVAMSETDRKKSAAPSA